MKQLTLTILIISIITGCTAEKIWTTEDFNKDWKFTICSGTAILEPHTSVFGEGSFPQVPYGCHIPDKADGASLLARSVGPEDSHELSGYDYDDTEWRMLDLPHDWAVEGDFNIMNPSGTGGGALPGGIGWYRKHFRIDKRYKGQKIFIDFDGIYMNSTVWINGNELGTRPYGYISFSYDMTPYINFDGDNVLAVRVNNSDQPNSRWYSGCGIYRNVHLRIENHLHIPLWGIYARNEGTDKIIVTTKAECPENYKPALAKVHAELFDANGKKIVETISELSENLECEQTLHIENPVLWSPQNPYLYNLKISLIDNGKICDVSEIKTGIRTFRFDDQKGFILNGTRMKINGVCLHHDLGALGAAVNKSAIERQLVLMKEMGVNAMRCSHNPPAPELLDICDSLGILVMDEPFDMWRQRKTERDYARFFDQWHETDLKDHVLRDRNHPSIFMWSIGNEVLEQWSNASADTLSLAEANFILNFGQDKSKLASSKEMSVNSLLAAKLAGIIRSLDPTRPITSGCNEPDPGNHVFRSNSLDVIGYNYHSHWFADVPKNFPGKPFLVTESVSALMTRGWYKMPSDSIKVCPPLWDDPKKEPSFACSSYDNYHVPWGSTHEHSLAQVLHNDFISGQFIWTGFDYLGEPIPYGWPARSSYFGIVDLAGFPKDIYYMYQSVWRPDINVLHIFPHWNWKEGEIVDIQAYYNNADCVELFLNGRSLGERRKSGNDGSTEFHVCWKVPFEKGVLNAVAKRDGKIIREKTIRTAGEPTTINLVPDKTVLKADGYELCFITVEILDNNGTLCPHADNNIRFEIEGPGEIAGVDNGSPISLERFKEDHIHAMAGKALVIIKNNGEKGKITIKAESDNGMKSKTSIIVR